MSTDRRVLAIAALGAIYLIWGSTYLAVKVAVDAFPPFLFSGARFVVAGGLMYLWARLRAPAGEPAPTTREWRVAAVAGGLLLVGGLGSATVAVQHIDSGLAALLAACVPMWMAVLDRWRFGRRMRRTSVVGLALGFVAVGALVAPSGGGSGNPAAALLIVLGSLAWAAGSLYSRGAPLPRRQLVATSMQMLAAAALFLVISAATGEFARVDIAAIGWRPMAAAAYLVVFGSVVGFTAYNWLLKAVPATIVATYAYVNPVVAVGLGWLLLGERLTPTTMVASTVIVLSVALIVGRRPRRAVPMVAARPAMRQALRRRVVVAPWNPPRLSSRRADRKAPEGASPISTPRSPDLDAPAG